ncbi:MAG: hypothetical protein ACK52I_11800 [Pseudomonadota bacterium]|jgi:hypothetical protein
MDRGGLDRQSVAAGIDLDLLQRIAGSATAAAMNQLSTQQAAEKLSFPGLALLLRAGASPATGPAADTRRRARNAVLRAMRRFGVRFTEGTDVCFDRRSIEQVVANGRSVRLLMSVARELPTTCFF